MFGDWIIVFNYSILFVTFADIAVAEPDERSIVTYVSLLYDVFPNVPSLEQSLRDNVIICLFLCILFIYNSF